MTDPITLRRANAADAAAIRALVRDAYAKWVPVVGREPRPMSADYDKAVRDHRIDLLYLDGALAALIETIDEPECLLIENVAVSPAFQGRGLGRHLLAHAEALAVAAGQARIRLFTNKLMVANQQLYARLGYGFDGEEAFPGAIAVHMSKSIGPVSGRP
ncbi:MAG: GNAT family N-acetyltransferase [Sphingomonas sp.]|jgi:GNAT superfamily N-acetyltransferase|uniref:GNAT family N-acetyltransferase n=1 Tax=Sphingomonas sp. TaxID=28214 RepID=UPI0035626288